MKINFTILLLCIITTTVNSQTVSSEKFVQSINCKDFDCFKTFATGSGITMAESPYKDAKGDNHQIIFNTKYEDNNVSVYSLGMSLRSSNTEVFLKSKNKQYFENFANEIVVWGNFQRSGEPAMDGETVYTIYKSNKDDSYEMRVDIYNDKEDKATYYIIKLTKKTG